jgi:hypothetical protein
MQDTCGWQCHCHRLGWVLLPTKRETFHSTNLSSFSLGDDIMAPPKGTAPRANQYMSFANDRSLNQATRRPSTRNLDSETNPLPPVSGQITYPTSAILPRDRGLGFETFDNRPETPAPKPVEKSARRRRKMSAWRRPSDDEWETDDDVSIASDLMPDSASDREPSPPRKKRKRDAKKE